MSASNLRKGGLAWAAPAASAVAIFLGAKGWVVLPIFDMLGGLGLRALFDMVERKRRECNLEHFALD